MVQKGTTIEDKLDARSFHIANLLVGNDLGEGALEMTFQGPTNAIESLNSTYRKLNRQRSVFPSDTALLKALYLATFEATKKWTMSIRNWGQVYGELSIMYDGRLPE